jgi:hypothetical protein
MLMEMRVGLSSPHPINMVVLSAEKGQELYDYASSGGMAVLANEASYCSMYTSNKLADGTISLAEAA